MTRRRRPGLFDRIHGHGAFARMRSMLDDPALNYENIARRFRITRQRVAQIAEKLGIDGRRRRRARTLRTMRFYDNGAYPAMVRAVAREIERLGMKAAPYRPVRRNHRQLARTRKRTLLIDGVPCQIHCQRQARKTAPNGRKYVSFRISSRTKQAKAAIFAFWKSGKIKLFVIPTRELKNVSTLWLPADGTYAANSNMKPKRDWTVYEGAWHLLRREKRRRWKQERHA